MQGYTGLHRITGLTWVNYLVPQVTLNYSGLQRLYSRYIGNTHHAVYMSCVTPDYTKACAVQHATQELHFYYEVPSVPKL